MKALLIFFLIFCLPLVSAARVIEGVERWQGEARIDETLRVEKSGKLILAPGTRVLAFAGIEVAGGIEASDTEFVGEDWPGLTLKGVSSQSWLKKCRISGAITGITVIGGEPHLTDLLLEGNRVGIELRQKSKAVVEGSTFHRNARVGLFIKDEVTAIVRKNRFEQQGKFGAYIYRALPSEFSGNEFIHNPVGLMISHFGSDPLIEKNIFSQNEIGIKVDRTARPLISANYIEENQTGIQLYRRSDPVIELNRLKQNQRAIHISYSSYPRIRHNDFLKNKRALVLEYQSSSWEQQQGAAARQQQLSGQGAFGGQKKNQITEEQRRARGIDGTVDARDNWWGTMETRELETLSADANLPWVDDGLDQPTFEDEGKSYPLDLVRWSPFAPKPYTTEVVK